MSVLEEEAGVGVEGVLLGMVYGARVLGAGIGGATGEPEAEGRGVGVGLAASSDSLSLDQSIPRGCMAFFCLLNSFLWFSKLGNPLFDFLC